jgi:hypothetical protein
MNATCTVSRQHIRLVSLVAATAMLLAGTPGWAGTQLKPQQIEAGKQRQAEQRQQREQARAPREPSPPRGDLASAPQPPRGKPGGGEYGRPPRDYGGGAGDNRPPPGHPGNTSANRPPRRDDDYRPPKYDNGRPGYSRPPYYAGRPGYRPPPPRYVPSLPAGYARHYWNGYPYYHSAGYWYRPWGSSFALVAAPYGLFVPHLSSYYSTFWYGGSRYFLSDSTYYLYDDARRGYVVTPSPYGDGQERDGDALGDQLYVYPAQGQSAEQTADDRYDCHRWAVEQTGFDPVDSGYDADRREEYLRALAACLTGRGYTVR